MSEPTDTVSARERRSGRKRSAHCARKSFPSLPRPSPRISSSQLRRIPHSPDLIQTPPIPGTANTRVGPQCPNEPQGSQIHRSFCSARWLLASPTILHSQAEMQVPSSANSMLGTALELGSSEPDPRQDPGAAGAGMHRTDNFVTAALAAEASQMAYGVQCQDRSHCQACRALCQRLSWPPSRRRQHQTS